MDNKISVIIPAYNVGKYIGVTLESVRNQTYQNLEILVINDGSTDETEDVIESYAALDSRIKVIHKENGGVTSARLQGIEEATGDWVGFVDGDDYIEPQMYERLLRNALKYNADISHCGYQMVFPDRIDYYYNTGRIVQQDRISGLNDLISGNFVEPSLGNKLFRSGLFSDCFDSGCMPVNIKENEDLLMNYWIFKAAHSAVYEDICPYHYVLRKGSATTSKLNVYKLRDPLRVARILLADVPDGVKPVAYRKLIRILIRGATMGLKQDAELIGPYRTETRKELLKQLPKVLFENKCGLKLKVMAAWTAVWPGSFRVVHRIHSIVSGKNKKYKL